MNQREVPTEVLAFGTIDMQTRSGRQTIVSEYRNASGGVERTLMLQVRSPFGHAYALTVALDGHAIDEATLTVGARVAVSGRLEWPQPPFRRADRLASSERDDVVLCACHIGPHDASDEGCSMQFQGTVLTPARVVRHPYRSKVLLAATVIERRYEHEAGNSALFLAGVERIPIAVPLHHPDAPHLLRPGNRVMVDSLLERVTVRRRAEDIELALRAFDESWAARRATIDPRDLADAERRNAAQRHRLGQVHLARMVVGSAVLLEGTPASPRESRALRNEYMRTHRGAQLTDRAA